MKQLRIFILSLFLALSVGCISNPTQNALSVVTTSADLYFYYENGEVVNFIDQAVLSDLELTQVLESLDQIDRSVEKFYTLLQSPYRHEYSFLIRKNTNLHIATIRNIFYIIIRC